ncbi:DNA cytosine methyltransferase [Bradyrhizobium sp. 613_E4_N2_2]|uniref:DNA cytosine methyltransferase n=1 Tax=Bradyrhizobium sp. 613_E4_N2_2 TaxID=3240371 RepID=UPI003F8C29DD
MEKLRHMGSPASVSGPTFIDAFAGCGGLSLGLMRAGWVGQFAIEKDPNAFETLHSNFLAPDARFSYRWPEWLDRSPWTVEQLLEQHPTRLLQLRGKIDLLAGGPPCQGFSSAGRRRAVDPRNGLVERYLELIDIIRPKFVLMENVLGFTYDFKANGKNGKPVSNFAGRLKERLSQNYEVVSSTLRASEFGVPQQRPRFFLVAVLKSDSSSEKLETFFDDLRTAAPEFLAARGIPRKVTARTALSDLELARNGTEPCSDSNGYDAISYKGPKTNFQKAMRDGLEGRPTDTRLAKHRPDIERRFKKIIALCHSQGRLNVQLSKAMRERFGLKKMAIRVLDPNEPAPTITSLPDDLLHYSEPRTLTVRENARLQTFPDWFSFKGKYTTGGKMRIREVPRFTQVANAVPPMLAELLGQTLGLVWRRQTNQTHRSAPNFQRDLDRPVKAA